MRLARTLYHSNERGVHFKERTFILHLDDNITRMEALEKARELQTKEYNCPNIHWEVID